MTTAIFNKENVVLENVKLIKLGFIIRGENRTSFRIVFLTPENKESSLIVESSVNSETTSNSDLMSLFNFYLSKKNVSLLSACEQVADLKKGFIVIDQATSEIVAVIKGHCYLNK